jgi:hypothetical protein
MPGRENLTIEEFSRAMGNRDVMHQAQFAEVKTLIAAVQRAVESMHSEVTLRQDLANGRQGKVEQDLAIIRERGCSQLAIHKTALATLSGDEDGGDGEGARPRWYRRPVVQSAGGGGVALFLSELIRYLVTHKP